MAKLTGPGPVFAFEWLMASRRWQAYAMRSLTVLLLLGVMTPVWYAWPAATIARQAEMNKVFYLWTAMILLGLVGLAAPAATAGAICLDKAGATWRCCSRPTCPTPRSSWASSRRGWCRCSG